ncbi:MAG: hypothetical protein HYV52_00760 [Parcubacteria group bacterium]|nr:hypothetical protein [Parcubacteria group bacterium]
MLKKNIWKRNIIVLSIILSVILIATLFLIFNFILKANQIAFREEEIPVLDTEKINGFLEKIK